MVAQGNEVSQKLRSITLDALEFPQQSGKGQEAERVLAMMSDMLPLKGGLILVVQLKILYSMQIIKSLTLIIPQV